MGSFAIVGVVAVGVLLLSGCGQAGSPSAPTTEGGAAAQATAPGVSEQSSTVVVGTSMPSSGNVTGEPLVPRDASGSPIPQTPTVAVSSVLTPDASGLVRVTLESAGQSVDMAVGQTLELALGEGYEWDVTIGDTSILRVQAMSPAGGGSQGLYKAEKVGQTTIEASGEPLCRKLNPPCGMPSRAITIEVTVR